MTTQQAGGADKFDDKAAAALAKVEGLPGEPLKTIPALQLAWGKLIGHVNLVSPVANVDAIPALHGISLRHVLIDSEEKGGDVYRDPRFCEKDERALGGVGLQKIMAAAGVQVLNRTRLDDRKDPFYCEIEITLGIRDYDGTWRQVTKARELNLRDGAPEAMHPEKTKGPGDQYAQKTGRMIALSASALADKRRHMQSLAETKALYRALRLILQLKQKYTVKELERPFVVPKLVPALDPADPVQKEALINMAVGGVAGLYGGGAMRELKDANPLRADVDINDGIPATTFAERHTSQAAPDAEIDKFNEDDFDAPKFPEPQRQDIFVCMCPCGCQLELEKRVADIGVERIGTPRCAECYPARRFDIKRHEDVGDLKLPKMPGLTAERVIAGLKVKP